MNSSTKTVVITLVIAALAACGSPEERKAKYRMRAQNFLEEGNFPKARVALRNVLKIDPKDSEAYYLYAQVEEKEHNWRNAFANYQRTVELAPDHDRAQLRLAKFYLEARMMEKVSDITGKVLAQHPDHVQAQALRIAVSAVNGQLEEAIKQAEALSVGHPDDADAALMLGSLFLARDRGGEAEAVLSKALAHQPKNIELLDGLATVFVKTGRADQAEALYRKMVEMEPRVFDHRVKLVRLYEQEDQHAKAETVLREAVGLEQDSEVRHLMLAEYLASHGKLDETEAALEEARRQMPHAVKPPMALASLYERLGKLSKARAIYEALRDDHKKEPPGLEARVRLAGLEWMEGKEADAERQLQDVLRENPRSMEGLLLQGKIALKRGRGKDAILAFRSVLKDQPDLVEGHLLLGQAHLQAGETVLGRESLERAVALNPRLVEAQLMLAGIEVATGHAADARRRVDTVLAREPNNLAALGALYRLQMAGREWAQTEDTLGRLRGAGAAQASADMAEGAMYQAQQQWDKAIAAYERASAAAPKAPEPLLALVQIDRLQSNEARAEARLQQALRDDAHLYAHGFMGEFLLAKGDKAGADEHFVKATRNNPAWSLPWFHLATIRISEKRQADAQTLLTEGLQANPAASELRLLLATSLTETGAIDAAIKEYETLLHDKPNAMVAANNLAALLVDQKGDPQSLERALSLSRDFERQAPNPFFLDTLGWVHLKLGHRDEAVRVMKLAVEKAPTHPVLNYHLGAAYAQSGRREQAQDHLRKALSAGQTFAGIENARALLAELNG
jgi:tetratricopeptide (TPR) repeat protein